MTRSDVIETLREKCGLTNKESKTIMETLEATISGAVASGDRVTTAIGTFDAIETKPRIGRNPQTGEPVDIPAGRRVRFKPSSRLKEAMSAPV